MSCCSVILQPPTNPNCPSCLLGNNLPSLSDGALTWNGTQWVFQAPNSPSYSFKTISASTYDSVIGDFVGDLVVILTNTGSINVLLPDPSLITAGHTCTFKALKITSADTLTITAPGGSTIDTYSDVRITSAGSPAPQPGLTVMTYDNVNYITYPR